MTHPDTATWLASAVPGATGEPCTHWTGRRHCGAAPTRAYGPGRRCIRHTPAALAGKPEPGAHPTPETTKTVQETTR